MLRSLIERAYFVRLAKDSPKQIGYVDNSNIKFISLEIVFSVKIIMERIIKHFIF